MIRRWLLAVALLLWPAAGVAGQVTVFAAASLRGALDDAARDFEARHGTVKIVISYAASSALARQIEAGAPAALFISADAAWMDHLAGKNLIWPDSRIDLLANSLVLIAPAKSARPVEIVRNFPLRALLGDGRLALAATAAVPAGRYGKAALQGLGVWPSVQDRLAEAENVRAALAFVARGEAPYGIVYDTDARAEPAVRVVGRFPPESHPPIRYPAALTRQAGADDATGATEAAAFLAYLQGPAARSIFNAYGFAAP